ncbi:hypothetical protein GGQ80_003315 [Sphingomonas jinjuensis]|uniref:Nickel/cobalt transporter regulator n=1 Tax=Sphingomonas jinjuensis TaxID=535907 RepID=A0A840FQ44_9SPHN|nr:RcnB family protein [Sphingomonas jinjuensis]MBB4155395.1 hypothetical protein [Sphingomonas jinjuensis]
MRKIFAALLAATALAPATAWAQEEQGRPEGPGMSRRAELREMRRANAGEEQSRGRDEWRQMREERREMQPGMPEAPRFERPAPAPAAPVAQSFDRQDRGQWRGNRDQGQRWDGGDRQQRQQRPDVAAGQDRPDRGVWRDQQRFGGGGNDRPDWRNGNRDDRRGDLRPDRRDERAEFDRRQRRDDAWQDRGRYDGGWAGNRFAGNGNGWRGNQGGWDRDWRQDRRYDWSSWRSRNERAYRLPRYYAPPGWGYGYRRFSIGVTLAPQLWGQSYWLDDPWSYRLPEAYGPFRWVRYYDDAMLIDVRTGRVVDIVYDIFY